MLTFATNFPTSHWLSQGWLTCGCQHLALYIESLFVFLQLTNKLNTRYSFLSKSSHGVYIDYAVISAAKFRLLQQRNLPHKGRYLLLDLPMGLPSALCLQYTAQSLAIFFPMESKTFALTYSYHCLGVSSDSHPVLVTPADSVSHPYMDHVMAFHQCPSLIGLPMWPEVHASFILIPWTFYVPLCIFYCHNPLRWVHGM